MSSIQLACKLLSQGNPVVMPTETVYGLASDATQGMAVAKIYALKRRPQFNPLILHVSSLEEAEKWAIFSDSALKLATLFWKKKPFPLTLVLKRPASSLISPLVTAGLETIAIRVPHHPVALELLKAFPLPLAAPSANRSMGISPTTSSLVQKSLGKHTPFMLDGGPCQIGIESTIVDLTNDHQPVLLRPGGTPLEDLEKALGQSLAIAQPNTTLKAPGMMKRHYAPCLPLRLNCSMAQSEEGFLGFGPTENPRINLNLSPSGDLKEAAANLFTMLNELDNPNLFKGIAVAPIPSFGLGLAINDRLERAATENEENLSLDLTDGLHPQA